MRVEYPKANKEFNEVETIKKLSPFDLIEQNQSCLLTSYPKHLNYVSLSNGDSVKEGSGKVTNIV